MVLVFYGAICAFFIIIYAVAYVVYLVNVEITQPH